MSHHGPGLSTSQLRHPATLAILCGGLSTRLGSDKGLYEPLGDEPLVARAVRLLGSRYAEVLVVVRDAEQAARYEQALARHLDAAAACVRIVHDDELARSPVHAALTGVATALARASEKHVLVLPVDQVGVRERHLEHLWAVGATASTPTAFALAENQILPFPSLWPRAAVTRIEARLSTGTLSVRDALRTLEARTTPSGDSATELIRNGNTAEELRAHFGEPLFDPFNRRLHYLRFSLTEACNLSCTYCLPKGFPEWRRHKARLALSDIETMLGGFRQLGFRKVRFTGGEPTVHPGCLEAVRRASRWGYERIALTTNGLLIDDLTPWLDAGLTHLNVSLDALDATTFAQMTGSRDAERVRQLVERAAANGLDVKVNTVLLRSVNGQPRIIEELIDWALGLPITLRFIELMETKLNGSFATSERVLGTEIEPYLAARGLARLGDAGKSPDLRGPATDYGAADQPGRIGLINPMSCNFCSKCNRLRITAKGRLKLCLFGDEDMPLDLSSPQAVALNVRRLIDRKPERHYLEDGRIGNVATFRTIGG